MTTPYEFTEDDIEIMSDFLARGLVSGDAPLTFRSLCHAARIDERLAIAASLDSLADEVGMRNPTVSTSLREFAKMLQPIEVQVHSHDHDHDHPHTHE